MKKKKANGTSGNGTTSGAKARTPFVIVVEGSPPPGAEPILFPLSCRTRMCYERSEVFRPYGRSHPRDLLLYYAAHKNKEDESTDSDADVLVLGCGDLRDVARTVSEARSRDADHGIRFLLNDIRPEALARNLLILHAIVAGNIVEEALMRCIAQLWFSLLLDPNVCAFWEGQLLRPCNPWLKVNSTFLLARADGTVYYAVPNTTLPFESLDTAASMEVPNHQLVDEVWDWVGALRTAFGRGASPRNTITFAVGHALRLMEEFAADPSKRFNVVDTGGLQDTVGLLGLLSSPLVQSALSKFVSRYDLKVSSFECRVLLPKIVGFALACPPRELLGGQLVPLKSCTMLLIPAVVFWAPASGIMASREDPREARASWVLPVTDAAEHLDHFEVTLAIPPGQEQCALSLPSDENRFENGGAACLDVNDVPLTICLPSPVSVARVRVMRKQSKVVLILNRIMAPVHWTHGVLGMDPQIRRRKNHHRTALPIQLALEHVAAIRARDADAGSRMREAASTFIQMTQSLFALTSDPAVQLIELIGVEGLFAEFLIPNRVSLLPPAGPGLAPTPAIECYVVFNGDQNSLDLVRAQIPASAARTLDIRTQHYLTVREMAILWQAEVPATDPRFPPDVFKRLRPHLQQAVFMPFFPV
ncbi:hypothetical protein H9P43_005214 [Blastocladiella emersonii ATCC 22665]|nr:hypothetical protein H9P43_005214 [Blastocladiella emersonii ATCC 22665]